MPEPSNPNPYEAPGEVAREQSAAADANAVPLRGVESRELALRRVRSATIIGLLPLLYELARAIAHVVQYWLWTHDFAEYFVGNLIGAAMGIALAFAAAWWLFYPAIETLAVVVHHFFARRVPSGDWQRATDGALMKLPYCVAAAAVTWMIYSICQTEFDLFFGLDNFYWHVLFGWAFNLIGAWFYLGLAYAWYRVWRASGDG